MGQQLGPSLFSIGGSVIGAFLGGPIGQVIGGLAGGIIGSLIFKTNTKPLVPDVQFMNSSYGNPIPIIWGTVRLSATMIWMDKVEVRGHSLGAKGLGGQTAYSYFQNASAAFCEGPAHMVKMFLDGKLFIDNTTNQGELTKFRFAIRTYNGTSDQQPDFLYKLWVEEHVAPPTSVPAFRDIAHVIFDHPDLAHFGGRFPQVSGVWSSDITESTEFSLLQRWSPDVTTALTTNNGTNGTIAVDWQRNVCYALAADNSIRIFDLSTHEQIFARTGADILQDVAGYPATISGFRGLVCGQGTYLYGLCAGTASLSVPISVVTFDASTLKVIRTVNFPGPFAPTSWTIGRVVQVTAAAQVYDILVGSLVGSFAFLVDPLVGHFNWKKLDTQFEGLTCFNAVTVGAQDIFSGKVDVYLASDSSFGDGNIYLYKATLDGPSVSSVVPVSLGTVTNTNFGASTPTPGALTALGYDPSDDTLLITAYGNTIKWSHAIGTIWVVTGVSTQFNANTNMDRGTVSGPFNTSSGFSPGIQVITTATGQTDSSPVPGADPHRGALFASYQYDSYSNSFVYVDSSGDVYVARLQRVFAGEVPIAVIIADICGRVGLDSTMIDTSLLTQTVAGYAVLEEKSAGAAIADLCNVFQIDMVESDYKLKFIPRGQPVVLTLTQAKLGSVDASDSGMFFQVQHTQELELPLQLNVKYSDPDLDYQPGSAYARRTSLPVPTVFSKRKKSIPLPIVALNIEARQIAEKILYTMWAERDTYETVLSPEFLWLDPGDNVTVNLDSGTSYTTRVEHMEVGADFSMKPRLSSEDATTYAGSTTPGALISTAPQVIIPAPFGNILLFNVPLLQDSDDTAGTSSRIYFAAGAYVSWGGGGMYKSLDLARFDLVTAMPNTVDWGYLTNTLGHTPAAFATDRVNTITVAFSAGSTAPSSISYTDLMNGLNACVIGSEIVQFQTVTANGDGTFTLSVLARGRNGTEWAVNTHHSGEALVMLEAGKFGTYRLPLTEIGQLEGWRLVPIGRFLDQVPTTSFTYLGYDLMPFAPTALKRAVSGSDLVATWERRTRFGGYQQDGIDTVALNEASEAYEAYVLPNAAALAAFNPTVPASYTRAFLGLTAPTLTYTAAQMAADSFVPATATLFLVVYQISAVIGRGFQGYKALPAF